VFRARPVAILVTLLALSPLTLGHLALGQTIVPLNTGYNHAIFAPYPSVTTFTSTINDNYWINIASYPPTNPPVASSWVLQQQAPWLPAFPSTNWISARHTIASPPGTSVDNPAYTIFKKCFCLLPNFKNASLSFQVRADDTIQVWFNTQLNKALLPSLGNYNAAPLQSLPSNPAWFHVGRNCIYVLLEDFGGFMGFDLTGTIQATGLSPLPAFGADQSFDCPCRAAASGAAASKSAADGDQAVVREILRIAEERRLKKVKKGGSQPN
jgi:hypothetical protein